MVYILCENAVGCWHECCDQCRRQTADDYVVNAHVDQFLADAPGSDINQPSSAGRRSQEYVVSHMILSDQLLTNAYIFRLHCSTTYVDAAYCYRLNSVVGLSVCLSVTLVSPAKRLNRSRCRLGCGLRWAQGTIYYMGSTSSQGKGQFLGEKGRHIVKYRDLLASAVQKRLN